MFRDNNLFDPIGKLEIVFINKKLLRGNYFLATWNWINLRCLNCICYRDLLSWIGSNVSTSHKSQHLNDSR